MSTDQALTPEELTTLLGSFMPDIPGYRVVRRIGRGGMSHVYLGVQESLDRQVAIKIMAPEALRDDISKERFEQEARTIAKLEHPCIVGIHEVGRTPQGLYYYVMPYLAKGHLGQRDFTQDEQRTVEVLRALLSALEYAHARGIVHRDVKAENVLFDNADRPLLTDFGIALAKSRDTARITTAGLAVGSGGYMAPEQARGEAVDGRADLYSVGVLAFELLTGKLPYQAKDPLALALMHAQDPPPRLPPERKHWQGFIDKAMAKNPADRFRNAQQMLAALQPLAQRQVAGADEAKPKAVGGKLPWTPILAGVLGILVVVAGVRWLALRDTGEPDFVTGDPPAAAPADPPAATPTPAATPAGSAASADPAPATAAAPANGTTAVDPAASTSASVPPAPVEAGPTTTATGTAGPGAFAAVRVSSTQTRLDYDPTQPGARELAAARRQIASDRLTQPRGQNAIESLAAARRLAPRNPLVGEVSEQLIGALSKKLGDAVRGGEDESARTLYERTERFARETGHERGRAWQALRESLPPLLVDRLQEGTRNFDTAAIARAKTLAGQLAVPQSALEPAWSQAVVVPRPGQAIRDQVGQTILVVAPTGNRGGFAAMREEVSRSEYSAFASATGRAAARCRNRLAPITIRARRWDDPGFSQAGSHPVVCVSYDDAQAYARWYSNRAGARFRLPTLAEWRQMADYRGNADACRNGRIDCGSEGTVAAGEGPASPLGLTGLQGNAREWVSDCGNNCSRRLIAGLGWRDSAGRADPRRSSDFDADVGYDDAGFRLVREVGGEE